jgi:hypothetical protein
MHLLTQNAMHILTQCNAPFNTKCNAPLAHYHFIFSSSGARNENVPGGGDEQTQDIHTLTSMPLVEE